MRFLKIIMSMFILCLSSCQSETLNESSAVNSTNIYSDINIFNKMLTEDSNFYLYIKDDTCSLCVKITPLVNFYFETSDDILLSIDVSKLTEMDNKDILNNLKEELSNLTSHNFYKSFLAPTIAYFYKGKILNANIGLTASKEDLTKLLFNLKNPSIANKNPGKLPG